MQGDDVEVLHEFGRRQTHPVPGNLGYLIGGSERSHVGAIVGRSVLAFRPRVLATSEVVPAAKLLDPNCACDRAVRSAPSRSVARGCRRRDAGAPALGHAYVEHVSARARGVAGLQRHPPRCSSSTSRATGLGRRHSSGRSPTLRRARSSLDLDHYGRDAIRQAPQTTSRNDGAADTPSRFRGVLSTASSQIRHSHHPQGNCDSGGRAPCRRPWRRGRLRFQSRRTPARPRQRCHRRAAGDRGGGGRSRRDHRRRRLHARDRHRQGDGAGRAG